MKKFFYIQIIFFCQFLAAATVEFRSDAGKTNFTAIGKPAMIKIQGEGEGPVGNLIFSKDLVSGTLKVSLDKLSTGIKMRDLFIDYFKKSPEVVVDSDVRLNFIGK